MRLVIFTCVVIAGMVTMLFELAGARIIAPYFGTSHFVWTSVIGVILGSLSIGYWLGGYLADRKKNVRILSSLFSLTSIFILSTFLSKGLLLSTISTYIYNVKLGGLFSALLLFAPASIGLGCIVPFANRFLLNNINHTGKTTGFIYALSTIGSIVGTFLGGFYLIPLVGINLVLCLCAGLLLFCSILLLKKINVLIIVNILLLAYSLFLISSNSEKHIVYETNYSHVNVFDQRNKEGQNIRFLKVNNYISSAIYTDTIDQVYDYLKLFRIDRTLNPTFKKVLFIGGSACSYPRELLATYADIEIDIIEIDPMLIEIAHQYFKLPHDNRLHFYYEDGRTFLNRNTQKYDVIYIDAFNSHLSVPYQLTTVEAIQKVKKSLSKNGVVITNLLATLQNGPKKFLLSELKTYQEIFNEVKTIRVNNETSKATLQNFLIIASNTPHDLQNFQHQKLISLNTADSHVLTDNLAPVNYYLAKR